MKRPRRNHGADFKAQVALAALKGDKTLVELAAQFGIHPTPITEWKQQLLERAADVFGGTKPTAALTMALACRRPTATSCITPTLGPSMPPPRTASCWPVTA